MGLGIKVKVGERFQNIFDDLGVFFLEFFELFFEVVGEVGFH